MRIHGSPIFVCADNEPEYVRDRLAPHIAWFEKARDRCRIAEKVMQYLIIAISASIPVMNVAGIATSTAQILSATSGALIAILAGIMQFEKYHDRRLLYKRTATDLIQEYYNWRNHVGQYKPDPSREVRGDGKDNGLALLIERCEGIIKDQTGEYIRYFSTPSPALDKVNTKTPN